MRDCLHDEQSKVALDEYLSQEAVDMLFQKFMGRYRPAIAAVVCQLEMTSKRKEAMKRSNAHYAQYLLSYCLSVYRKGLSNPVTLVHGRRLSRMQRTGWYLGRIGTSKAICATRYLASTTNTTNIRIGLWSLSTACWGSLCISVACLGITILSSRR